MIVGCPVLAVSLYHFCEWIHFTFWIFERFGDQTMSIQLKEVFKLHFTYHFDRLVLRQQEQNISIISRKDADDIV